MEKNTSLLIVAGVAIGVVVIYVISSYSGFVGTQTYGGDDPTSGSVVVATSLECTWSADNTLEATLLGNGSPLATQTIRWSVAESLGRAVPPTSVTDNDGVARSQLERTPETEVPVIIAAYEGVTGQYGASWCELSPSN